MATDPVIDVDALVAPVSADQPVGPIPEDRWIAPWSDVEDAYKESNRRERKLREFPLNDEGDPDLSRLIEEDKPKAPDWANVVSVAKSALLTTTKDLWIATYLVHGLSRTHGFAGMRDGFQVMRRLVEQYWDQIIPRPDEEDDDDGIHLAVLKLSGLNDTFPDDIRRIPLIPRRSGRGIHLVDYEDARQSSSSWISQNEIDQAAKELDAAELRSIVEDVEGALAEYNQLITLVDEKLNGDGFEASVASTSVSDMLEECLKRAKAFLGEEPEPEETESSESGGAGESGGAPRVNVPGVIRNRRDAFDMIRRVAEFFEKSEPHSPISALLREAENWRTMDFRQLMDRLMEDDPGARENLFKRTGIRKEEEEAAADNGEQ